MPEPDPRHNGDGYRPGQSAEDPGVCVARPEDSHRLGERPEVDHADPVPPALEDARGWVAVQDLERKRGAISLVRIDSERDAVEAHQAQRLRDPDDDRDGKQRPGRPKHCPIRSLPARRPAALDARRAPPWPRAPPCSRARARPPHSNVRRRGGRGARSRPEGRRRRDRKRAGRAKKGAQATFPSRSDAAGLSAPRARSRRGTTATQRSDPPTCGPSARRRRREPAQQLRRRAVRRARERGRKSAGCSPKPVWLPLEQSRPDDPRAMQHESPRDAKGLEPVDRCGLEADRRCVLEVA